MLGARCEMQDLVRQPIVVLRPCRKCGRAAFPALLSVAYAFDCIQRLLADRYRIGGPLRRPGDAHCVAPRVGEKGVVGTVLVLQQVYRCVDCMLCSGWVRFSQQSRLDPQALTQRLRTLVAACLFDAGIDVGLRTLWLFFHQRLAQHAQCVELAASLQRSLCGDESLLRIRMQPR